MRMPEARCSGCLRKEMQACIVSRCTHMPCYCELIQNTTNWQHAENAQVQQPDVTNTAQRHCTGGFSGAIQNRPKQRLRAHVITLALAQRHVTLLAAPAHVAQALALETCAFAAAVVELAFARCQARVDAMVLRLWTLPLRCTVTDTPVRVRMSAALHASVCNISHYFERRDNQTDLGHTTWEKPCVSKADAQYCDAGAR